MDAVTRAGKKVAGPDCFRTGDQSEFDYVMT